MFKLTAVITTLVLGTSSSAMASPRASYRHAAQPSWLQVEGGTVSSRERWSRDPRYRDERSSDGRFGDDFGPRRYRARWLALGAMQLERGRDVTEVHVPGTFTQLRFQLASGRSSIDQVIVRFHDGSSQVATVNRMLTTGDRRLDLPLDGNNRRIDRIVVIGDARRQAEIQVFGI